MATRFHLRLPNLAAARGSDADLAFRSDGAEGLAAELQAALRTATLFERWLSKQDDPDGVSPGWGATDPAATVSGEQHDLAIELIAVTSLPGDVFKQRLRWLAGSGWELRDVSAA